MRASLYRIDNVTNGKSYIGVTVLPLGHRFALHKSARTHLGQTMRAEGVENFRIVQLAVGEDDYLYSIEPAAILSFDTLEPHGYNRRAAASGRRVSSACPSTTRRLGTCADCGTETTGKRCRPCHSRQNGLKNRGRKWTINNKRRVLTLDQVSAIRCDDRTYAQIAKTYGTKIGVIGRIKRNETWVGLCP